MIVDQERNYDCVHRGEAVAHFVGSDELRVAFPRLGFAIAWG
jgi:hypothetical protein